MPFYSDAQAAALTISRMVFHLVGPDRDHFQLLEEIRPGRFEAFFLDRIRSVQGGNLYRFSDASATRERLSRVHQDATQFQPESEKLADDFQRLHGGAAAPGAFLLFVLEAQGDRSYALLKYDDESVLGYDVTRLPNGRGRVTLDQLERTFVQNKHALQKAALIRLADEGGELVVLDRQPKVARYFEGFLDAIRLFDDDELTRRLRSRPGVPLSSRKTSVTSDARSGYASAARKRGFRNFGLAVDPINRTRKPEVAPDCMEWHEIARDGSD